MEVLQLLNLLMVPALGWIIRVEKKLARIEMLLNGHNTGNVRTRKKDKSGKRAEEERKRNHGTTDINILNARGDFGRTDASSAKGSGEEDT